MENILIIHIFSTLFMCGLCWFVQVVHYPLFKEINRSEFSNYERKNLLYTSFVAIPIMAIEGLSGLYLLYLNQDFLHLINVILLVVVGLSTFIFQAPLHLKLLINPSFFLITKLIRTNWIRTVVWSVRSGLMFYIITF